jgi:bacillithiol biosynthesis cysteine-adding enzyme BshC
MDCRAYLASKLPHTTKLSRDFVEDFEKLARFYAHPPKLSGVLDYARSLKFPEERRREVAGILRAQNLAFGGGAETEKNLARLENGAVAIVSGQQVGLLGGPAFSFYKAMTAIATAREVTKSGVEAVPVFWMATEDHDVDEVRHTTWFADGKLQRLEVGKHGDEPKPVGQIPLGREIDEILREAGATLAGPFGAEVMDVLRASYKPEETYGSAFAKMFARIFGGWGLILLDPLDEKLHRLAAPIMCKALAQRDEIHALLTERGKELERAGYDVQVKVAGKSTLVFSLREGHRQAITATNEEFASGGKAAPRGEWLKQVDEAGENFSPNALLRPVMQDYLLPTAAYFGGPAEIAYYAQSQVVYEKLLGRMPVILSRADFTLVDPKAVRLLKKYGLEMADVWQGLQHLLKKMYGDAIPKKLAKEFDHSVGKIEKHVAALQDAVVKVDPTMKDAVARAERRLKHQVEKLRRQTGQALDRQDAVIRGHAEFLENLLFPHGELQSRQLCFLPFLARMGTSGLEGLMEASGAEDVGKHCVVEIV